jgi:hypothetical protein
MATLKNTNKAGGFYVIRTGEPTGLIKIGRYKGKVPSTYPWQYLRYRYKPRTDGRASVMLLRHIVTNDPAQRNYQIDAYEAAMIKYMVSKTKPVYGDEWFWNTKKTRRSIRASLNETNAELGARKKSGVWMGEHFAGSPKKTPDAYKYVRVMPTAAQGKPRGQNHVARNYPVRKVLLDPIGRPKTDRRVTENRLIRAKVPKVGDRYVTKDGEYTLRPGGIGWLFRGKNNKRRA